MVDAKLALTTTRADAVNVGALLRSWQVGQTLQALVTDKAPSGQLTLRIGGHQVNASADVAVQKGALLKLEVTSLSPTLTLKIVPAPTSNAQPAAQALDGQLKLLLPRQGNVTTPLSALLDPRVSANILALLGGSSATLAAVTRHLSRFEQLSDPKQLRAAVNHSGLFLESRLLSLLMGQSAALTPDLKADLLKLRQQIDQAALQSSQLNSKPHNNAALKAFSEQLDGALSTITLNQLASRGGEEAGRSIWLVHLPLSMSEPDQHLSLSIAREQKNSAQESDENDEWRAVVDVSLPSTGAIEADIFLRKEKLSLAMYCDRAETAQLMQQRADELRVALESRGMEVAVLASHKGRRTEPTQATAASSCVDERA
tara:strand:+ start:111571 stop:112686 length:1116 start_codon:yes stop_codon:yes gene_type:complete